MATSDNERMKSLYVFYTGVTVEERAKIDQILQGSSCWP